MHQRAATALDDVISAPRVVTRVDTPVDRREVMRYLGYPPHAKPNPTIERMVEEWVDEAARRATPRATYRAFPVAEIAKRKLALHTSDGTTTFVGAIGEFLGRIEWVVGFIATAGPGVEGLAGELLQAGDTLAGLIVNAVGSERAEAAEFAVIDELRGLVTAAGLELTLPYSPGYCGMHITEQNKLFGLFGDQTAGVKLTSDCLMRPLKSVSGLIGIGAAPAVTQWGSPCERCDLKNCNMRR